MRKICRLHVLIRIQPDQYQARPIRGQDLGGVPAPGISACAVPPTCPHMEILAHYLINTNHYQVIPDGTLSISLTLI